MGRLVRFIAILLLKKLLNTIQHERGGRLVRGGWGVKRRVGRLGPDPSDVGRWLSDRHLFRRLTLWASTRKVDFAGTRWDAARRGRRGELAGRQVASSDWRVASHRGSAIGE